MIDISWYYVKCNFGFDAGNCRHLVKHFKYKLIVIGFTREKKRKFINSYLLRLLLMARSALNFKQELNNIVNITATNGYYDF